MSDQAISEIPFATDDQLAERIRRVAAELIARGLPALAAELDAVARILAPDTRAAA